MPQGEGGEGPPSRRVEECIRAEEREGALEGGPLHVLRSVGHGFKIERERLLRSLRREGDGLFDGVHKADEGVLLRLVGGGPGHEDELVVHGDAPSLDLEIAGVEALHLEGDGFVVLEGAHDGVHRARGEGLEDGEPHVDRCVFVDPVDGRERLGEVVHHAGDGVADGLSLQVGGRFDPSPPYEEEGGEGAPHEAPRRLQRNALRRRYDDLRLIGEGEVHVARRGELQGVGALRGTLDLQGDPRFGEHARFKGNVDWDMVHVGEPVEHEDQSFGSPRRRGEESEEQREKRQRSFHFLFPPWSRIQTVLHFQWRRSVQA